MRPWKIVVAIAFASLTGAFGALAGVRHLQLGETSLVVVENDPWEPDEFAGALILRAAFVDRGPTIDGLADDPAWARAESLTVPLAYGSVNDATLKAVYTTTEIFLLVSWADSTKDDQHHPWVWDPKLGRYVEGPQVEDALIVSIEGGCEWNPSILAGYVFDFDAWLWLAARSNPLGQAVDADGSVREREIGGSVKYRSRTSKAYWNVKFADPRRDILTRPWQGLTRIYRLGEPLKEVWVRYQPDGSPTPAFAERLAPPSVPPIAKTSASGASARQTPVAAAPQYRPVKLTGDAGDVAAKGRWSDGRWTVELRRALRTPGGTMTDSLFERTTQFSVHIFDHTERVDEASESGRLYLQFEPAGGSKGSETDGLPEGRR